MNSWISIPLTTLITLSLVYQLKGKGQVRQSLNIMRSIRPIMVLTNLPVIAVLTTVGIALSSLPILGWSWSALVTNNGSNINLIGLQFAWFAPFFALLLIVVLPLLAQFEEHTFRAGTFDWKHGIKRSIVFGLVHTLAGISLGFALALIIAGLWFTRQYFKGGVERSTAYHTAWNLTLVGLLTTFVVVMPMFQ